MKNHFESSNELPALIKKLEALGFKVFEQKPYQETYEIDGQTIKLPFTNMAGVTVVLKKEGDQWQYVGRSRGSELGYLLKALLEENK